MQAYHFVGDKLRDGRPVPPDGEWLEHTGEVRMCGSGLHASEHPFDALYYAPGATLCWVELEGVTEIQSDKVLARRRKILARFDATDLMWAFARECALSVIHLWDAPAIVRDYLETGDESKRAAAYAAAIATASASASASAAAYAAYYASDYAPSAAAAAAAAAFAAAFAASACASASAAAHAEALQGFRARFAQLVTQRFNLIDCVKGRS